MILLTLPILISCGDKEALKRAAADQARATARVNIPPPPTECLTDTPHAPLLIGADPLNVLKLERIQLNRSNESKRMCVNLGEAKANTLR